MRTVKAHELKEWDEILLTAKQRKPRIIKKIMHISLHGVKKVLLMQPNCAQICLDPEEEIILKYRIGDIAKEMAGELN